MCFLQRQRKGRSATRLSMIVSLNMYVFGSSVICGNSHRVFRLQNIRVVAKYYRRISLTRLTSLLGLGPAVIQPSLLREFTLTSVTQETEAFLSNLVVNKTIFARMDRPAGIITFTKPQEPTVMLNEWSNSIHSLLDLIVKTNHLITKEEMVHSLALDR